MLVSGSHHVREDMAPVICGPRHSDSEWAAKSPITTTVYHTSTHGHGCSLTINISVAPGVRINIVTLVAKDAQGRPLV